MVTKVLGKRIYVEILPKEELHSSGLFIHQEKTIERADIRTAKVLKSNLSDVAEGDVVMFDYLYCTPYKGKTAFLDEIDILVVVE